MKITIATKNLLKQARSSFQKGKDLQAQGNLGESIRSYQEAVEIKPDYVQPLLRLGRIHVSQENWSEAAKCYRRVIALESGNYSAYVELAKVLLKQNKIYGAIAAFQEAIELNPELPGKVYRQLGDLFLQERDDLGHAIAAYGKASEVTSDWAPGFYLKYANTLMEKKLVDEAIVNYKRAIQLKSDSDKYYLLLGNALVQKGDLDNAISCYNKVLELTPDSVAGHKKLGDIYQQKDQLDSAHRYYQKALELKPDAAYIYRSLGDVFSKQGRHAEAEDCYNRSV